jgi:glycosyltransferase involved in cell wall biosynthesis
MTYYGKYLKKIIINLRLEKHVIFTGLLSESEMCQRYIRSHVFVCPSSIENSPNSLGESMILGVPSVASFVGGIPDMLKDKEDGFLYQHDAPYMLAYYVCKIFEDDDLALKFSTNARKRALRTHDISQNTKRLMDIYDEIILQT